MAKDGKGRYHVVYSGAVLNRIKEQAHVARELGKVDDFRRALETAHRSPSGEPLIFWEPIKDLIWSRAQVRIGIVAPLAFRFVVYPDKKLVWVVDFHAYLQT